MTRRGMTLVEMLVAMTATLLIMAAVAQAFSAFGNAISGGRSVLELDARMRSAAWRLRSDLAGATARPLPPLNPSAGEGYLEIIEGPNTDSIARQWFVSGSSTLISGSFNKLAAVAAGPGPFSDDRLLGDDDDALLLTTRSVDAPFIGRAPGIGSVVNAAFESTLAEVGWFARPTPGTSNPVTYTLYRKQLLVMGYMGTAPFVAGNNSLSWSTYGGTWAGYLNAPCDVSVRREGNVLYPNTLADLTRPATRFMHNISGVTTPPIFFGSGTLQSGTWCFVAHQTPSISAAAEILPTALDGLVFDANSQRRSEDVVLTNVLAFDVRVFDPGVPVSATANASALVPGDPGFVIAPVASGAYVDLGQQSGTNSLLAGVFASGSAARFQGFGDARSGLRGSAAARRTYDTWSLGYEADGFDQDNDGTIDDGTNGLDDDGDGVFDEPPYDGDRDGVFEDPGEVETMPPYPVPLRGIEVRIRCYEPSSRQVRQVTVRHTFVPH
jgi:prepilin-type N-terminal cleavage/methylation domain-containing protein